MNDSCEICEEFGSGELTVVGGMETRIIHQDKGSVVAPTVGCLVEGYVLMMPERHVISFARLSAAELDIAAGLLHKIRSIFGTTYGPMAIFEHGMGPKDTAGGCVSHAHWHIFPSSAALDRKIRESLPFQGTVELSGLGKLSNSPYLLFMPSDGDELFYYKDPVGVKSQHVRRIIAAHHGIEDAYDWAVAPFVDRMQGTFDFATGTKAFESPNITLVQDSGTA